MRPNKIGHEDPSSVSIPEAGMESVEATTTSSSMSQNTNQTEMDEGDRRGDERGSPVQDSSDSNGLEESASDIRHSNEELSDTPIVDSDITRVSQHSKCNSQSTNLVSGCLSVHDNESQRITRERSSERAPMLIVEPSLSSIDESKVTDGETLTLDEPEIDEPKQLSRVNSMVETGSMATIRGSQNRIADDANRIADDANRIADDANRIADDAKRSQSSDSVSERRGTHIARLIQSKSVSLVGDKPIYPNVPFSPYGSPSSSPGLKRRPLKECSRVSIETNGDYTQLNQYKLKEAIGQVNRTYYCKPS